MITALNPEAGTTCYGIWSGGSCINGYDSNSNLLKKTDARNITITYAYDALNRLLDTTYSDGTTLKASHRYDYSSFQGQSFTNPMGREVAALTVDASNNTVSSIFTSYETMGRVTSSTQCHPGVTGCKTFAVNNYDKLGDITSLTYPGNGFTVTYGYDSAAQLTSATDSNGVIYAQTPTYSCQRSHTGVHQPQLQQQQISRGLQQPASADGDMDRTICAGALFDKQYSYGTAGSNNGNIYTITNVKDSTRTQGFTYDTLNRLSAAGDQTHWSNTYVYDAWGNLYQKNPGALPGENLSKVPDANNHLSGLTYDAGGNVTNDGLGGIFTYEPEKTASPPPAA